MSAPRQIATETQLRRLAFVKYLYALGVEQSATPEPLSSASVLLFHDAVELFNQLAAETVDAATRSGMAFLDYWEALAVKVPGGITQKASMRRLNEARVNLKHHGTLLTALDVRAFRDATTTFFEENTPKIFGVPLADVSLTDLVWNKHVQKELVSARDALRGGDIEASLRHSAVAFARLLDDYEETKTGGWGKTYSPFFFGRDMNFLSSFFMGLGRGDDRDRKLAEFVDKVKESIEAMQDAVKVLALGLDYRRFARFETVTPPVSRVMGSDPYLVGRQSRSPNPTADDAEFCIDYVIESALRLQSFDFEVASRL